MRAANGNCFFFAFSLFEAPPVFFKRLAVDEPN